MIVDSGTRGHVISEAYEKSDLVNSIVVAGMGKNNFVAWNRKKEVIAEKNCSVKSPESILRTAKKYMPNLIDVAQDNALALGSVDLLQSQGFKVFGPSKKASRIEWDKAWSRNFMKKFGILHPEFKIFKYDDVVDAENGYVSDIDFADILLAKGRSIYIKASGLCEGKGALRVRYEEDVEKNILKMGEFGKAGETFLVEEGLEGEEFSFYAISDGMNFKILGDAKDYKRVFNNDEGEQTGGMGSYSPTEMRIFLHRHKNNLVGKVINGLGKNNGENHTCVGNPFRGILYVGGIIPNENHHNNKPHVIEYNVRWGDPECQVILPGIKNYLELVLASIDGNIENIKVEHNGLKRVCVVGTSKGYPGDYEDVRGKKILGLRELIEKGSEELKVYGEGIYVKDGEFYANGGRLFSIVGEGKTKVGARGRTYEAMANVNIEGNNLHYRKDIAA